MSRDASFAEGAERPLRLMAETADDLAVIATLAQDAVGAARDAAWLRRKRRFVVVVNRFRWEDAPQAERAQRPYERVRAALTVENALAVRARGIGPDAPDRVYNLLDVVFDAGEDGAGTLRLVLSGGAEIAIEVEALDVSLCDLSRPWEARGAPRHDGDAGG